MAEDSPVDDAEQNFSAAGGLYLEADSEGAAGLEALAEDGAPGAAGDCC